MKEIKIKIYKFEELSDEAKKKAIEWWRHGNDMPELNDVLEEEAELLLGDITKSEDSPLRNFEVHSISCQLGFCQSDFLTVIYDGEIEYNDTYYTFKVMGGGLQHQLKPEIAVYGEDGEEEYEMEKIIRANHEQMCRKLMKWGHDYILEQGSDEVVSENIIVNEYDFREDGTRWVN